MEKTIAGITAIAALVPFCCGAVYAEPAVTDDSAVAVTTMPELEEPMPEEEVAAMIAETIDAYTTTVDFDVGTASESEALYTASDSYTEDGLFSYVVVSEKAHITGYYGGSTEVVIPETVDDASLGTIDVNYIDPEAFYGNQEITSLYMPNTVVGIGANAFCACMSLTDIRFSPNLTAINADAFCMCSSLVTLEPPEQLNYVGDETFAYCTALETVSIPGSLLSISTSMFTNCTSLKTVTMGEGVITSWLECVLQLHRAGNCTVPGNLADSYFRQRIYLQRPAGAQFTGYSHKYRKWRV